MRNLVTNDIIFFILKKALKNIISYYIHHERVTSDDRDPPWINKKPKQLILEKNEMYKRYVKENKDPKIFDKVNASKTN